MGIMSKIQAWIEHPAIETEGTPKDWLAGIVVIVILSFLWSRVIKQLVEA